MEAGRETTDMHPHIHIGIEKTPGLRRFLFYIQILHPIGFLYPHLSNRQRNPLIAKLRNANQIPTFKTRTVRLKKSLIPFAAQNYHLV